MKKVLPLILFIFLFPAFVFAADKVEINTASLQQLDEIAGIGPAIAQRIIDARPFSLVDDLLKVKGIGPAILQKIKDQGLACVDCKTVIASEAKQSKNEIAASPLAPRNDEIKQTPYPSGIFINEIMPNPKGADETDEWIELYNSNNSDVDLSGWQIQDTEGTPATFTIPKDIKITANGFLVFKRPETKIMLNNDKDGLNLLTPDKKIVDSVNFASAPLGQSYNKISSGLAWSTTMTPGTKNIITKTPSTGSGPIGLSKAKNSVKNEIKDAGLADISRALDINQDENLTASPWFLFLTVLAITIILSVTVLIIKLRFKNHVRT